MTGALVFSSNIFGLCYHVCDVHSKFEEDGTEIVVATVDRQKCRQRCIVPKEEIIYTESKKFHISEHVFAVNVFAQF